MFKRNLRYLRKQRGVSQEQIAKVIGISRTTYADYENGKSEPTISVLNKLTAYFGVNAHDLLNQDFDAPLFRQSSSELQSLQNKNVRVIAITVLENQKQNIELINTTAIAGYGLNYRSPEFIKNLPRFSLPKLSEGTYRAFEIQGDSMPPIDNGFVVIGKYIEHYSEFKDGRKYVLVLKEEGVVFKRIINEVRRNRKLILFSDNTEYLPFSVKIEDVLEAWEMVAFIGYPDYKTDHNDIVIDKLNLIENKLNNLETHKLWSE